MSYTSDSNATYVNGQPVNKADVRSLWSSVDKIVNGLRDAGTLRTVNVAGTGNAITADLSDTMANAGISGLSGAADIEYIPVATNEADNPTITIAGATYGIRNADGRTWPAGGFVIGRSYKLRRRGTSMRVIAGDVTSIELSSARADLDTAIAGEIADRIAADDAIRASKADLQNSGKFFTSRDAAVAAGQANLPGNLSMIVTVEGDWIVFRSFSNASDDPLFTTQPSWGVARRAPNQPVITAIQSDLDNGRVFYASGATSPSGRDIPQRADLVIANHNASNSYSIWRSVGPPPDGLETETMTKDISGRWWVFSIDRSVSEDASVKAAAIRDSVVMPLANIGGTGDAITADLAATMTAAGITSLSNNSEVEYIPVATNAAENPTITIAGVT